MAKLISVATDGQIKGYLFYCPGCKYEHYVTVKPHENALGASWDFNGDLENPTFQPSILQRIEFQPGTGKPTTTCHSFVTNGKIQFLSDCTHSLAEQTVDMTEMKE